MSSPVLSSDEASRAFLQRRVRAFALGSGCAFLLFWCYRASLVLFADTIAPARIFGGDMNYHLLASASLLSTALLVQIFTWSMLAMRWLEALGLIATSLCLCGMGRYIPVTNQPGLIVAFAMTMGLFNRCVFVPSTPLHTLVLSLAMGAPIVLMEYVNVMAAPVSELAVFDPTGAKSQASLAMAIAIYISVWWLLATVGAVSASWVTYGLRREVTKARRLGQYVLEELIGRGGMGEVYRARHAMLRRPTAVKLLLPERAGEHNIQRFEREVTLTARLTHPCTVTIYDYGRTAEGVFYYAMELLEGYTLQQLVDQHGALSQARAVYLLQQAASALAEAHAAGLVHRDIKPSNLMICQKGGLADVVQVLDFGLVKDIRGSAQSVDLTNPDLVQGTPLYMAPEALSAPSQMDGRGDLYALGALAYFLVTGSHVFDGQNTVEVCAHHLHSVPETPSKRLGAPVNAELESLILQCLKKEPQERPQSADELCEHLQQLQKELPWSALQARSWWRNHPVAKRSRGVSAAERELTINLPGQSDVPAAKRVLNRASLS